MRRLSLRTPVFLTLALAGAASAAKNPAPRVVLPSLEWENAPAGKFRVQAIGRIDAVSRLPELRVTGESLGDFRPERFVGQEVSFLLTNPPEAPRRLHGYLISVTRETNLEETPLVLLEAAPWLHLLTKSANEAVFQNQTVPEILQAVFHRWPQALFAFELRSPPPRRALVCQYRETDFNFVSRLMEEEGLFYFFRDAPEGQRMIITDRIPSDPGEAVIFKERASGDAGLDRWVEKFETVSSGYTLMDYGVDAASPVVAGATGEKEEKNDPRIVRDVLDTRLTPAQAAGYARLRLEENRAARAVVSASGNQTSLSAGDRFRLKSHPDPRQNTSYWVTETNDQWTLVEPPPEENNDEEAPPLDALPPVGLKSQMSLSAIPADTPFRPRRNTPKPLAQGIDVARVVALDGPRVQILFFWNDPVLGGPANPVWAPSLLTPPPRPGDRVIVEFVAGDPDRPVVTAVAPPPAER